MTALHGRLDGPADGSPLILGPSLGTALAVWDAQVFGAAPPAPADGADGTPEDHRTAQHDAADAGSGRRRPEGMPPPGTGNTDKAAPGGVPGGGAPSPDESLAGHHRVLRWDLPGHGGTPASAVPADRPGATRVADLATRVLDLADSHGLGAFNYAGVSLGGAVGLWLAVHRPERIRALAVVCSSARFGDSAPWHERAALVRREGTAPLVEQSAQRWFAPGFRERCPAVAERLLDGLRQVDPAGYAACCDALADYDLRDALRSVAAPTLVVAGRQDPATPLVHARELTDPVRGIPGARLLEVDRAAHLAQVEQPRTVTEALLTHFSADLPPTSVPPDNSDRARSTGAGR